MIPASLLLLLQVGIFHSRAQGRGELREGWREKLSVREEQGGEAREEQGRMLQTGIIRTNCVDCLDRWEATCTATSAWTMYITLWSVCNEYDLPAQIQKYFQIYLAYRVKTNDNMNIWLELN